MGKPIMDLKEGHQIELYFLNRANETKENLPKTKKLYIKTVKLRARGLYLTPLFRHTVANIALGSVHLAQEAVVGKD